MLLRSMQNTQKELADAKAESDALRDDVAAGRRRLLKKRSAESGKQTHRQRGYLPPRLADTAEQSYFTLRG